ncbi:unnamed protein product [Clavelina lepadiformis]|uniref:Matrin-type domain-containing protein n=1 Tax=Clavelina lepadiformis TaxID=159417 RepID=A0ABP0G0Z0_CLALP
MDFQHRAGGKTGSGGVASLSEANRDRRERLRQLALETIDLNKDPYFMKNHLGSYECKLCLTLHNNEGSYLAHTQGKKHQSNLAKRAARDAKETPVQPAPAKAVIEVKKFVKIGRPGYKVTKQRVQETGQQSLLFQVDYPEMVDGIQPRHRFMSAYEQHVEPPDRVWQYLLFAAEPYETIAFKVPSREIDKGEGKFWTYWNKDTKQFFLQFHYKIEMRPPPMMMTENRDITKHDEEDGGIPLPPGTLPPPLLKPPSVEQEDFEQPAPPGMYQEGTFSQSSHAGQLAPPFEFPGPAPQPVRHLMGANTLAGHPVKEIANNQEGSVSMLAQAHNFVSTTHHGTSSFIDQGSALPPPPPMPLPPDMDEPEN